MAAEETKNQIIIKKIYFDNIRLVIDKLNDFFTSNFKNKNFPVVDSSFTLDGTILNILNWLNNVDPTWINNMDKIEQVLDSLEDIPNPENNTQGIYDSLVEQNKTEEVDKINAFIGFKMLQYIADHFEEFNQLINGIYTFELYIDPGKYQKAIDVFSVPVPTEEIKSIMDDVEFKVFDMERYVNSIFMNKEQITMPDTLKLESEINRCKSFNKLEGYTIAVDETVQEAARIDYFEDNKPEHIKYDSSKKKFIISNQYKASIDTFISELNKCETTEDLIKFFSSDLMTKKNYVGLLTSNVLPFILSKVFNNNKKYPFDMDEEAKSNLEKYIKSYNSIVEQNNGAKRFINYDLFSTFKTDKENTMKYLKDFLTLELYNNDKASINNNTLLVLFNIFDSRIYFDILYSLIPEKDQVAELSDKSTFVKTIRSRINQISRMTNIYRNDSADNAPDDNAPSADVQEFALTSLQELGDMSIADMMYCEQFHSILYNEIKCMNDAIYNKGVSQMSIDAYIGESVVPVYQEGFFSNLKKSSDEKKISKLEEAFRVKFSNEFKQDWLMGDKSFYITYFEDPTEIIGNIYNHQNLNDLKKALSETVPPGLYPIGWMKVTLIDKKALESVDMLYSDTNGAVYSYLFSFNRSEPIKCADSIKEFITNLDTYQIPIIESDKSVKLAVSVESPLQVAAVNFESSKIPLIRYLSIKHILRTQMYYGELYEDIVVYNRYHIQFDNDESVELVAFNFYNDGSVTITLRSDIMEDTEKPYYYDDVDNYLTYSLNVYQEQETGDIPDYMKNRINMTDDDPGVTVTDVDIPDNMPSNNITDLAGSINARMDTGGDSLGDMLGSGYNNNPNKDTTDGKVIYNITYTNSFNRDSNNTTTNTSTDSSTGKTTDIRNTNTNSNNDSSSNKKTTNDFSNRKSSNNRNTPANNYNNSNDSAVVDDTEVPNMIKTESYLQSGKTLEEIFTYLEAEEPLSDTFDDTEDGNDNGGGDAGKPPKEDTMTKAMDLDRKLLATQQKIAKKTQKIVNTGRAIVKPAARAKQKLTALIDSLIKRDEDKVKAEIIENPSYRTSLYKAMRLALKFGLTGVAFTISGYLGAAYVVMQGAKFADKQRLRKEVQEEFATELKILDDKIESINNNREATPEDRKAKWQMMRLRSKMEKMMLQSPRQTIKSKRSIH